VRFAALVAVVLVDGAVLDERPAVAMRSAAIDFPVERVQDLAVDPAQRHVANQFADADRVRCPVQWMHGTADPVCSVANAS
jgi:pimeloyl-ACP methyl ester carboxylesterase